METIPKTKNPFIPYFLILVSFFIILFFTRGVFSNLQISLDAKEQLTLDLAQKQEILTQLNEIQGKLSQSGSLELAKIQPFLGNFSDADILEYIYDYAQKVNLTSDRMIIRDLSVVPTGESDIGFQEAKVTVSTIFSSEATMMAFLDYVTATTGKYQFYITEFQYPMNDVTGNIQVTIPLTLYYNK